MLRLRFRLLPMGIAVAICALPFLLFGRSRFPASANSLVSVFLGEQFKKPHRPDELTQLERLWERLSEGDVAPEGLEINLEAIERLIDCKKRKTCGPGEETVILFGSEHFLNSIEFGRTSGEDVWGLSTIRGIRELNHTMLYTRETADTHLIYQYIPDMIPIILWEGSRLQNCIDGNFEPHHGLAVDDRILYPGPEDAASAKLQRRALKSDPRPCENRDNSTCSETTEQSLGRRKVVTEKPQCVKLPDYLLGVPLWKSFAFHFWGGSQTPLGSGWTLSPYDLGNWRDGKENQYLGYSVEPTCTKIRFRDQKKPRGFILGKHWDYFKLPKMAFPGLLHKVVEHVRKGTSPSGKTHPQLPDFSLVTTADPPPPGTAFPEKGVDFLETYGQGEWLRELSHSAVLVGLGSPGISPSPFDALCLGVPFINVIDEKKHPTDRTKWPSQHEALINVDPPYVYHVMKGDEEGLADALRDAVNTPIQRFILPGMGFHELVDRIRRLVKTDWLREAREVVITKKGKGADELRYLL